MQTNTIYGLTHNAENKLPIIREKRELKVGIGIPKGRAIQVLKFAGKWHIKFGEWTKTADGNKWAMKTVFSDVSRESAEAYYRLNKEKAAVSNRPQELKYFTFGRRRLAEEGGKPVEIIEPDWDAIEAHGEVPNQVEILLMSNEPLSVEMAMWSASEKRCHGDGLEAMRVLSMGSEKDPGWKEAKDAGEKYFPISKCVKGGCPYAQESIGPNGKPQPPACKPSSTLVFQLSNAMRLGVSSYFVTTAHVSTAQIFSAIEIFRDWRAQIGTGLRGLTLIMRLGSFKANHKGHAAIKPSISLEIHPRDMKVLVEKLQQAAWEKAAAGMARMIETSETVEVETLNDADAGIINAEFYDAAIDEDEPETVAPEAAKAKEATDKKTADLGARLKAKAEPVVVESVKPVADAAAPDVQHETDKLFGDFGM